MAELPILTHTDEIVNKIMPLFLQTHNGAKSIILINVENLNP